MPQERETFESWMKDKSTPEKQSAVPHQVQSVARKTKGKGRGRIRSPPQRSTKRSPFNKDAVDVSKEASHDSQQCQIDGAMQDGKEADGRGSSTPLL